MIRPYRDVTTITRTTTISKAKDPLQRRQGARTVAQKRTKSHTPSVAAGVAEITWYIMMYTAANPRRPAWLPGYAPPLPARRQWRRGTGLSQQVGCWKGPNARTTIPSNPYMWIPPPLDSEARGTRGYQRGRRHLKLSQHVPAASDSRRHARERSSASLEVPARPEATCEGTTGGGQRP
jgi:hypothetical protein